MAGIFTDGVAEVRPGSYFTVGINDGTGVIGAKDGIVAVLFQGTFGPLGEVIELADSQGAYDIYGDGGKVDAVSLAFAGGAKTVLAVRVGSEGTASSVQLGEIATVTAKYPGKRRFSITVKDSLTEEGCKQVSFYSGNKQLESYTVEKNGSTEGAALKAAMANSTRFTVKVGTDGALEDVAQKEFTEGTDPTVNVESYEAGFKKLESVYCNAVCAATEDPAVHLLLKTFLDQAYDNGFFACGVAAELSSTDLETRIEHALMFNDEKMVYVLNAQADRMEEELNGYQVAAIIAGMYASYASNQTLTHKVLEPVSGLKEVLTSFQMTEAEQKGCLVLSKSPAGKVWVDNAINTLVELPEGKDAGWKKLRRTKTRFELMYRMNTTADSLVGKVDNDKNGRETVIAQLNEVGAAMVQEGKLTSCSVTEYPDKTANTDYAYFLIDVVDRDSLEHLYLYYNFVYSTSEEG